LHPIPKRIVPAFVERSRARAHIDFCFVSSPLVATARPPPPPLCM
jgi:hypothetical protein